MLDSHVNVPWPWHHTEGVTQDSPHQQRVLRPLRQTVYRLASLAVSVLFLFAVTSHRAAPPMSHNLNNSGCHPNQLSSTRIRGMLL